MYLNYGDSIESTPNARKKKKIGKKFMIIIKKPLSVVVRGGIGNYKITSTIYYRRNVLHRDGAGFLSLLK